MNLSSKLVILDLDETLIYATSSPKDRNWSFEVGNYKVYKRPYLEEFLDTLKKHFKVAVWSSAGDTYVEQIVCHIFPKEYKLQFVWGRSKCTPFWDINGIEEAGHSNERDHYKYCKVLKKVKKIGGASLKEILIVDDTPHKARYNYGNAIYPSPFIGNMEDNELPLLMEYLLTLKEVNNVRTIEKRDWKIKMLK